MTRTHITILILALCMQCASSLTIQTDALSSEEVKTIYLQKIKLYETKIVGLAIESAELPERSVFIADAVAGTLEILSSNPLTGLVLDSEESVAEQEERAGAYYDAVVARIQADYDTALAKIAALKTSLTDDAGYDNLDSLTPISFTLPNALVRKTGDLTGIAIDTATHELIWGMVLDLVISGTGWTETNLAGTYTTVYMQREHWDNLSAIRQAQVTALVDAYGVEL